MICSQIKAVNTFRRRFTIPYILTVSLPFICTALARRDSVLFLLSISSMIPWMCSPEMPWKSMAAAAAAAGRNVQLLSFALHATTSINQLPASRLQHPVAMFCCCCGYYNYCRNIQPHQRAQTPADNTHSVHSVQEANVQTTEHTSMKRR